MVSLLATREPRREQLRECEFASLAPQPPRAARRGPKRGQVSRSACRRREPRSFLGRAEVSDSRRLARSPQIRWLSAPSSPVHPAQSQQETPVPPVCSLSAEAARRVDLRVSPFGSVARAGVEREKTIRPRTNPRHALDAAEALVALHQVAPYRLASLIDHTRHLHPPSG